MQKKKKNKKKYGAHSHVRATARREEHIIHSRGQPYVVRLALTIFQLSKYDCIDARATDRLGRS